MICPGGVPIASTSWFMVVSPRTRCSAFSGIPVSLISAREKVQLASARAPSNTIVIGMRMFFLNRWARP